MSPVFLSSKVFDARYFSNHRADHVQNFSALWDKKFPTENSDKPFLCKRCFDTRTYLKHGKGPLRNISALWDKKISTDNSEVPLLSVGFFDTRFFLKHRRVAVRKFSVLWDLDFDKKSWYTPLSSCPSKFSIPQDFWNTKGSPTTFFAIVRQNLLQKSRDTTLSSLIHNIFRYQNFSETQKGCPTNFFDAVRQNSGKKVVTNPLLSYQRKVAQPENFWNTEVFPHEFFRNCGTKKCQQIIVKSPCYS